MRELDIAGLSDELVTKFYSGRRYDLGCGSTCVVWKTQSSLIKLNSSSISLFSVKSLKSTKSQWDSVPYRSTVAFAMTRIIGAILLLRKFQGALHDTYG